MIFRADIIRQGEPKAIKAQWQASLEAQAALPGFRQAKLHEVYRLLNDDAYRFVSITEWDDQAAYAASLRDAGHYTYLTHRPKDAVANTYTLINGAKRQQEILGEGQITVVNPYRIPASEAQQYADMWDASKQHMQDKPGFLDAQLLQCRKSDDTYYFVSRATWQNEALFLDQFAGKDFREIVAPYEGIFSITLTRLFSHVESETNVIAS